MNAVANPNVAPLESTLRTQKELTPQPLRPAPAEPLGALLAAIRADATERSQQYVLRCNTGHDGE
ncbi:hypothetical protein [Novipirellula artificiosorum]|uniref:Uncharacterized protein n=1 Tax=Novipirellula artificiosorum TaxID=2528016 RepID=A0A5C6DBS8_9BACT|nr:hypothetical protein [Novipirellula artificiosorum]TWU34220.1 hypothetical protein Poly41_43660 [Novipirellula artificiosorum]